MLAGFNVRDYAQDHKFAKAILNFLLNRVTISLKLYTVTTVQGVFEVDDWHSVCGVKYKPMFLRLIAMT